MLGSHLMVCASSGQSCTCNTWPCAQKRWRCTSITLRQAAMGGLEPVQKAPQALLSVCPLVAHLLIPDPLQLRQSPCKGKYMSVRALLLE